MITHHIDLNLIPTGVLPRINVSQYDYGESVECTLWNGDVLYTIPTGVSAKVSGTKKDNTGFEYNCTIANNKITFAIRQQMTAFEGEVATELTLYNNANRLSTINFILNVEKSALQDDVVISETDIPIIQEIPEIVEECEDYADKAHKWATYGSDSEQPSATNNSKYWAQQSQQSFQKTDVYRVMGYNGAKNYINTFSPVSIANNGVTYTTNSDGSITVSGTPTGDSFMCFELTNLKKTKYTVTGLANTTNMKFVFNLYNGTTLVNAWSITSDRDIDLTPYTFTRALFYFNRVTTNVAVSGTVYPMLRLADDTDTTYQPYAMTNKELTDNKVNNTNIAITQNGSTASQTLNAGSYIMRKGQLYKVTTTIASGSAITEGVNIESATVGNELTKLNRNKWGTAVDLMPYNSSSNRYTIPNDGYITTDSTASANNICYIGVSDSTLSDTIRVGGKVMANSLYVKAGMKVFVSANTGTGNIARYCPFN